MKRAAVMAASLAACGAAHAEICYGPTSTDSAVNPTAATVFTCPSAGAHTLNQLAALGWRVVKITPVSLGGTQTAAQLVLRPVTDAVFANGFDG